VVLKNGMVVYIAEDRALPLVNIALTVRVGSWLEPVGKEGWPPSPARSSGGEEPRA
jgi:predicted Zn-dependent peptidase